MNLKEIHNVYFIGIGGIGMSALARYFKFIDKNVSGYDKTKNPIDTGTLADLGIEVHYSEDISLNKAGKKFKPQNTLVSIYPSRSRNPR